MRPPASEQDVTDDAALVRGLKAGDSRILGKLMSTHWVALVAFAHRFLGGTAEAEDVVQTAFVRLWARRSALAESGSIRSLLYTIVRNACLDEIRKDRRRKRTHSGTPSPPPPRTPYEDVQGAELQRLAQGAVARLPERRREVFRLVREEGLSYQEVAEVLGLSPQTVANHMSLAMADLRTVLRPYLSGEPDNGDGEQGRDREQIDG